MNKIHIRDNWSAYLVMLLLFTLCSYALCIFYDANLFGKIVFFNAHDSFMDYFNCLVGYREGNPFASETSTNYPALAVLFYKVIAAGVPTEVYSLTPTELKSYQFPWMILGIYTILLLVVCRIVLQLKMKLSDANKIIVETVLVLCYPAMYALERGNIINVAFVLTLFFVMYYRDERKFLRELAYISLVFAAALKLYPAVFGLVLVKEKRIKEAIKLFIYGIGGMVIPFFAFGGVTMIFSWIKGLFGFSNDVIGGANMIQETAVTMLYGYNYSLKNIFQVVRYLITGEFSTDTLEFLRIIIFLLVLIEAFVAKEKWKEWLCYAILIATVPSFASSYVTLFFIIPFLEFLNSLTEKVRDKTNLWMEDVFAILMAVLLIPWPFPFVEKCNVFQQMGYGPLPFQSLMGYVSVCLMISILIVDLLNNGKDFLASPKLKSFELSKRKERRKADEAGKS